MSTVTTRSGSSAKSAWAAGGTVFAATMMVLIGIFQILMGLSAISRDSFIIQRGDYFFNINTRPWGWIHLVLGALVVLTGIGLFTGATWAKVVGIALVGLSAIDNFLFLPYYPIWSIVLIGLDAFVIWALATSLSERRAEADLMEDVGMGYGGGRESRQSREQWATNPSAGYRSTDPEAARRASDVSSARHAQPETEEQMHSAMAGGAMGGRTPQGGTPTGQPPTNMPGTGQGPRNPIPPGDQQ